MHHNRILVTLQSEFHTESPLHRLQIHGSRKEVFDSRSCQLPRRCPRPGFQSRDVDIRDPANSFLLIDHLLLVILCATELTIMGI